MKAICFLTRHSVLLLFGSSIILILACFDKRYYMYTEVNTSCFFRYIAHFFLGMFSFDIEFFFTSLTIMHYMFESSCGVNKDRFSLCKTGHMTRVRKCAVPSPWVIWTVQLVEVFQRWSAISGRWWPAEGKGTVHNEETALCYSKGSIMLTRPYTCTFFSGYIKLPTIIFQQPIYFISFHFISHTLVMQEYTCCLHWHWVSLWIERECMNIPS